MIIDGTVREVFPQPQADPGRLRGADRRREVRVWPGPGRPRASGPRRRETRFTFMSLRRLTASGARGTAPSRRRQPGTGLPLPPGRGRLGSAIPDWLDPSNIEPRGRGPNEPEPPAGPATAPASRGPRLPLGSGHERIDPPEAGPARRAGLRQRPSGAQDGRRCAGWSRRQGRHRARRYHHRGQRRFHHRSRSACRDHPQGGTRGHAGRAGRPHRQANPRQGRRRRTDRRRARPGPPGRRRRAIWG